MLGGALLCIVFLLHDDGGGGGHDRRMALELMIQIFDYVKMEYLVKVIDCCTIVVILE